MTRCVKNDGITRMMVMQIKLLVMLMLKTLVMFTIMSWCPSPSSESFLSRGQFWAGTTFTRRGGRHTQRDAHVTIAVLQWVKFLLTAKLHISEFFYLKERESGSAEKTKFTNWTIRSNNDGWLLLLALIDWSVEANRISTYLLQPIVICTFRSLYMYIYVYM